MQMKGWMQGDYGCKWVFFGLPVKIGRFYLLRSYFRGLWGEMAVLCHTGLGPVSIDSGLRRNDVWARVLISVL